ncbi:MAG: response regulator [Anaerolineae bacterium]|nr:response regulator [Anaerolineae bacterium]
MANILVVEDDADLVYIYRTALAQAGYSITMAQSGREARAALDEAAPDLVYLDMSMPDQSGLDVIDYIHADDRFENTKIVVVTADESWRRRIPTSRIARFLVKPVSIHDLVSLAKTLLG